MLFWWVSDIFTILMLIMMAFVISATIVPLRYYYIFCLMGLINNDLDHCYPYMIVTGCGRIIVNGCIIRCTINGCRICPLYV